MENLFPSNSGDSQKTLDGSSPADQTLDAASLDFATLDDITDPAEDDDEIEENRPPFYSSPVRTFPSFSSSHWAEPWSKLSSAETSIQNNSTREIQPDLQASDWDQCPSEKRELEAKPPAFPLLSEDNDSLVGAGLANLGNTCFLNAILQCFTHTVPLVQGLRLHNHPMPSQCKIEGFCVICSLRQLIELSFASTGKVISPWQLVNNLSYFSSAFQRFQQEDAHEFLQCFLDRLEIHCDYPKLKDIVVSQTDNFVKQAVGGRLVSKLRCCNCGHCSDTYEPSIDLSLEIEDVDSLPAALESFTKVEKIEDPETKFTCENCKEQVSVEKQLLLDQTPSVAAFHLKRFKNDGSVVEKIEKHIGFPLELDLHPYIGGHESDCAELKYDLYAVVVHIGFSATSGHYYCFIRSAPDTWYKFDDSKVVQVQEDFVLSQEAYILFYAKQGTPWFSSFIKTLRPAVDPIVLNTSPKSVLDNTEACTSSPSMPNNYSDVNEMSDTANEASTENLEEQNDAREHVYNVDGQVTLDADNSVDVSSIQVDKVFPLSVLKESNSNQELRAVIKNTNSPQTPSRSPSPEIYREDPPDNIYTIPYVHLRSAEQIPCKRQLNKELDDTERKQACSLIKKSMRGLRAQQLMAAVRGSQSEGSIRKKSRRMESSTSRDDRNSTARRTSSISPGLRPVAAGNLR